MFSEVTIVFPDEQVTLEDVLWILFKGPFICIVLKNGDEEMYPYKDIERIYAIKDGK
jgi:hypothetical protein